MINPYKILKPLNIPIGYMVNPKPNQVPFVIYFGNGTKNFKADNKVFKKFQRWCIHLYTKKKDVELEEKIEILLDENGLIWEKGQEVYVDSEKVYLTPYFI